MMNEFLLGYALAAFSLAGKTQEQVLERACCYYANRRNPYMAGSLAAAQSAFGDCLSFVRALNRHKAKNRRMNRAAKMLREMGYRPADFANFPR